MMTWITFEQLGLVSMAVLAPLTLVLVVLLLRGYDVNVTLTRKRRDDE